MEKIQGQQHTITTFYYALSRMLERASYYGFRSIIVLYMIGETLKMESNEALKVYGWFTLALVITHIIGAVFGDLLVGNKKGILIGGVTQAIGAFSLCIPSTIGLYLGICLVVLGSGFFTPNIISNFGKSYLNKTKLLDSGFTIFYLAINLGAFFWRFANWVYSRQLWLLHWIYTIRNTNIVVFSPNFDLKRTYISINGKT